MLKLGVNNVGKMFLCNTCIAKAYLGTDLVYDARGVDQQTLVDNSTSENEHINTGFEQTTS